MPKINEKYFYKDFSGMRFNALKPEEFNDSIIVGSCFYRDVHEDCKDEEIAVDIFPKGMAGVIFRRCNLDNVLVPAGNKVEDNCTNKRIKVQNDLCAWELDEDNQPARPIAEKMFAMLGLSTDPKDIPAEKMVKSIIETKHEEIELAAKAGSV